MAHRYSRLAREHDALPVAIVLEVPETEYLTHNAARPDRDIARWRDPAAEGRPPRGLRGPGREGFRKVHVLDGTEEIEQAVITYEGQYNDRRCGPRGSDKPLTCRHATGQR